MSNELTIGQSKWIGNFHLMVTMSLCSNDHILSIIGMACVSIINFGEGITRDARCEYPAENIPIEK